MKVSDIIRELNRLGGKHGVGIIDIVENRVVGMKSRGVYETPGGTILMEAHDQLEELVLDRDTLSAKKEMGNRLANVVYEGKWFTPLREAIQAFVTSTQKYVTGEVKFKLYKGNIIKAGTTSPYSLYSESLASFTTGDQYDHHDADGFITLFGLPLKVRAMMLQNVDKRIWINKNPVTKRSASALLFMYPLPIQPHRPCDHGKNKQVCRIKYVEEILHLFSPGSIVKINRYHIQKCCRFNDTCHQG